MQIYKSLARIDTTSRTPQLLENRSREGWVSSLEQRNGFQEILNLDGAIDGSVGDKKRCSV